MISLKTRRCREVIGPAPGSVAVIARPTNRYPPEKLILDERKQEAAREEALKAAKYNEICNLRNNWETWTDRKIQINTVKRRMQGILSENEFHIEERRDRLREMLAQEEDMYLKEMETHQETTLERQARMRERAKSLREKREQERLEIVKEKYDQQFRDQCEELRQTLSKRNQDEVAADRIHQLHEKAQMDEQKREEEAMWARLWEADMLAKADKEEKVAQDQLRRNKEVLEALQLQMAALEEKKREELALKQEEARLLEEQAKLRKLEEQKELEEKIRRKRDAKELFDSSLREKMRKKARDVQEQLAFDMKMLEQLLEESRNEALEQMEKKRATREEDRRYREYLKAMLIEEKLREAELDKLIDAEVERTWQKRLAQWRTEKEARQKLLNQVIAARKQQVEEKKRINALKQVEAQKDREELLKLIEENKQIDSEQLRKVRESSLQHQNDLLRQIEYNALLKSSEVEETRREYILGQQAELEYQTKIREALDNPFSSKAHPFRKREMHCN